MLLIISVLISMDNLVNLSCMGKSKSYLDQNLSKALSKSSPKLYGHGFRLIQLFKMAILGELLYKVGTKNTKLSIVCSLA